jgi:hypothetical protein
MEKIKSRMHRHYVKFLRLAFYSDLHGVRLTLALAEFIWSVSLFLPGDTFGRPTYMVMERLIHSEEAWACIFLFSAITQFYIVMTGNYHDRSSVIFAGANSILWWTVVISMYLSVYPIPAAIGGELALAFAASWVYVRSGWIANGSREAHGIAN